MILKNPRRSDPAGILFVGAERLNAVFSIRPLREEDASIALDTGLGSG